MDPGIPNAPITTLAGVASLTDCKAALPAEYSIQKVVPELPLPLPAPQAISNKSLLFHPRVEEEAKNLLRTKDAKLIPQLVSSLEKTSAEHIEVKDNYSDKNLNKDGIPNLLKALLEANQQVFSGNKALLLQQQQRLLQQKQYQQQQLLRQQQQATQVSNASDIQQQLPNQHVIAQQSLPNQSTVNQSQQLPSPQAQGNLNYQQSQQLTQQPLQSPHLANPQTSTSQPNLQSQQQTQPQQQLPNQHLIQQQQVQAAQQQQLQVQQLQVQQQQQQQLQVQQQQLKNQLLASQQKVSSPQYTSHQPISSPQYSSQAVHLSNQQSPQPTQQQQTPLQPSQQQQLQASQQQQLQALQQKQLQALQQQQLQDSQQQQLQASEQQQLQALKEQQLQASKQQQLQDSKQQQLQALQRLQVSQQQQLQESHQKKLQATTEQPHLPSQQETPVIQPVAQDVRVIQETPQNQVRIQPAENSALPIVDKIQLTTPVDPKLTSPTPVDPKLTSPTPVDPKLTSPIPVDPKLTSPTPVDPKLKTTTAVDPKLTSPTPVETDSNTPLQTKPVATSVIQHSDSSTTNVNSNKVVKQPEVVQTNNHQKIDQPTPTPPVTHSKLSELRMMRRPSNRGQQQVTQNSTTTTPSAAALSPTALTSSAPTSTALSSTAPSTNALPVNNVLGKTPQPNSTENQTPKNANLPQNIKQPIIRLGRISEADQALLQKSLKEFIATKPQLAKELGINLNKVKYKEDSGSEDESRPGRKRKKEQERSATALSPTALTSTALSSTAPSTNALPVNNFFGKTPQPNSTENQTPKNTNLPQNIKQLIIQLRRISEADQALLQKSLKEFIATKPQLAKELGINLNKANYKEDSGSEDESRPGRKRKKDQETSATALSPTALTSTALSSTAPSTNALPVNNFFGKTPQPNSTENQTPKNTNLPQNIKQLIIRLRRISEAPLALLQKSLKEFIATKPQLAKELGINLNKANYKEHSGSEDESRPGRKRKKEQERSATALSPTALTSTAPSTNALFLNNFFGKTPLLNSTENQTPKNTNLPQNIKQPIIRLGRISKADQALLQKSLKEFIATKPQLAKKLGINLNKANYKEDSSSEDESRPGRKQKKGSDDEYEPEDPMDTFSALMGKRRKLEEKDKEKPIVLAKPKLRKVEKKFVATKQKLSSEELMESNTYVRFNKSVQHVLRSADDMDFAEIVTEEVVQDEYLLSRSVMHELCTEAAKLKTLGAMEMFPTEKFTRLLHVLELNIRGGDKISPVATDDDNESIREYYLESTMERVLGAADACLVCLHVMTSPNMNKRVYIEEVIDRIVLYIKYHLSNTIFPSYDSTYRLDNKKKDGRKKQKTVSQKGITQLYTKISEAVSLLAELMHIQVLTDTSVLHASSMGIAPFFVENISELQLASLKLVTTIFTKYENHRRLLLDDILASIARLPSTKRSLRTYRLNHEENIQMLTALVLQLIQCVVALPEKWAANPKQPRKKEKDKEKETENLVEKDILICNKIEKATQIAGTFLKVFLSKCGSKQEEIDYRPLFENFIQDLLATVNKPEWPATELLLSILGKMLVQNFSNKSTEMSLRLASLDYLGVVAARLRRDSVLSRCKVNTIDQMIKDIKQEESRHKDEPDNKKKKSAVKTDDERIQFLQKMLLDFLGVNSQTDESYKNARHFYICQWYKNLVQEKAQIISDAKKKVNSSKKKYSDEDEDGNSDDEKARNPEQENQEKFRQLEEKKKILISRILAFQEATSSGGRVQVFQTYIDYDSAELIAQFLSSKRYFSQSFDQYLRAILVVLKETSIGIRTKAMKCLTMIVEADPSVLGRPDMQMGVNQSILDSSTSVREAAVDLIGKFILRRPELIHKYYQILSPRILDTGVSVRKRVIKILKDICIECPEFPKVPEICVKMIRRINDEEGIRKLVTEVFQNMWFTPTKDEQKLIRKVMHITDVVASSKEIGLEWFEQLLVSLYRPKEDKDDSTKVVTEPPKVLVTACRQIVDCLIENILRLEEANAGGSNRLVACVTTLLSFTKIRPQLLIKHASTLQPYLALKCRTEGDKKIVSNVAAMLELVVPMLEHPSDTFLAQLEEDAMKLILSNDRPVVASCLACLGSIINKVTHNFQLIRDLFKKFNHVIVRTKNSMEMCNILNQSRECIARDKGFFKRALFVVGLLLRHFDFRNPEVLGDLPLDTKDQVYLNLMFFLNQEEQETQVFTLKALGSICIRHYEFMLEPELKTFYHRQLTMIDAPLGMKTEVLVNIESYLVEEEKRMIQQDLEWKARSKHENLKEMNDVSSGMASTVIQLYLKEIMQSYLHQSLQVRQPALRVIQLIYSQGLVHPVKTVPYLICMSTDPEKAISHSADKTMADIEKKYPGFIHTQAGLGIRLSYELQRIIQNTEIVRGSSVKEPGEYPGALNGYLYSLLRNSRQQRRALILKVMKHFDEQARTSLSYMLYLADDLAYFPYQVQDEPLFIVHHIDLMISNTGTNLLQSFRESLISDNQNKILDAENGEVNNVISALDEDDDEDALATRVPEDASHLQACLTAAQGCLLLLVLKQHIKDVYGLSDGKIQLYSPSEPAKVFEKAINRRSNALFNPKSTIAKIKEGQPSEYLDENGRRDLIRQYLDFKHLMLQLDPEENEDDENKANPLVNLNQTGTAAILTEADQVILQNYKDKTPPKVPKLVISHSRFTSDIKPKTPRSHRTTEKAKKVKHKKKRRKITSDSESDENDYSDPDWT